MSASLDKLRKFFRLEHDGGYNNTAIIGGLAKMLDYWEGEARTDGIKEEIVQAVVQRLRSYEGLKPESRADSLKGLWKRIGEEYPDAVHKSDPKQPPRPAGQNNGGQSRPPRSDDRDRDRNARPPGRSESVPGAKISATPAALNAELTVMQGVGPKHAETLGKLGLHNRKSVV